MATYLSTPYQGSEFVSGVPLDLITKVGMMKQMKYEQTVADIQGQLDTIGNQDIIKDTERQYVAERLKGTVNKLNEFGGVDLSDSTIANQLRSYTANLARDQRIYNAVADTRQIRNNMSLLAEIKEKHPEQYASQNEALFMEGINSYLAGPEGTRYTGQAYIPYYNYDETYRKIAKDIQDNPDIKQDIEYVRMPDGTLRARSAQEVKQVTKEKIQQALLQSSDQRAIRQMQIDYQSSLPNKSWQGAVEELNYQKTAFLQKLKEAKDYVARGIEDAGSLEMAKRAITELEGDTETAGILKQLDGKIAEVRATGDPTKYYTFDKYMKDYTAGLASSFAYEQRGKIEYDDMFMEDYKFQLDSQLEQVRSSLRLQEEKSKTGATTEANKYVNNFLNSFYNLEENENKETNMDSDGLYALFDANKNTDGSATLTLGQGETFLSLGKVMEANGIQEQNSNKLTGYSRFLKAYNDWTKTNEGRTTNTISDRELYTPGLGDSGGSGFPRSSARSIDEFLQTQKGRDLSKQVKDGSGLDLANATDLQNIKNFAASEDAQLMVEFGNALTKLKGQIGVRPMDGMNFFSGNDGQYYGKFQGLFTQSQLETALGGSSAFNKLVEKGIVEATLNSIPASGKREEQTLYSLPIIRKVQKDIGAANVQYMTGLNGGDNFYIKNLPGFQESFQQGFNAITSTRGLNKDSLITQGQTVMNTLADKYSSPEDIKKLQFLKNQYDGAKAILSSGAASAVDKVQAKKFLNDLINNSQNFTNFTTGQNTPVTTTTTGPRKPGQTVAEYTNNPGNVKYIQNGAVQRLYGGTDSGIPATDGGTFVRFPDLNSGFKAYQATIFGPSDGLFKSSFYQPTKTVDQAMRSYSNYRTERGKVLGYNGDIYPEVKNKQLKDLTQQERDELSARMLRIENTVTYNQLRDAGIIKA